MTSQWVSEGIRHPELVWSPSDLYHKEYELAKVGPVGEHPDQKVEKVDHPDQEVDMDRAACTGQAARSVGVLESEKY